jgi:methylmalonyl-CoA mutase cobalamin-binding subunit
MATLKEQGFARLFGPGTHTEDIATWIQEAMAERWAREAEEEVAQ